MGTSTSQPTGCQNASSWATSRRCVDTQGGGQQSPEAPDQGKESPSPSCICRDKVAIDSNCHIRGNQPRSPPTSLHLPSRSPGTRGGCPGRCVFPRNCTVCVRLENNCYNCSKSDFLQIAVLGCNERGRGGGGFLAPVHSKLRPCIHRRFKQ